ncbi:hypothetical protein GF362_06250 [Candidatus Dojkabacteria bacterium]|nr:hypothetical protein [Candidatus Dojkabacteria bacterium]
MNNKKSFWSSFGILGCAVSIILIIVICVCVSVFSLAIMSAGGVYQEKGYMNSIRATGKQDEKVAVIYIEGIILDIDDGVYQTSLTQYVIDALDEVIENENYKAAVLVLNTPGGGVYDSARISDKIKEAQAQDKVVVSVIEEMAASGGYWIAAPTDYILIQPESITGSIGVLFQTIEYEELFNKIGLEEIIITNRESVNKVPDELENKESEQYKLFEDLLDNEYEAFIQLILEGREITRSELRPYADGRLIDGRVAVKNNLADAYGGFEEAIEYLKSEKGIDSPHIVDFHRMELIGWNAFSGKLDLLAKQLSPESRATLKMYLLPEIMFSEEKK